MYQPSYFSQQRPEILHELIRQNAFATLISVERGNPIVSHLPFFLDDTGTSLVSHMAKANPHWELFERTPEVMVVFQGPHAYVSPAWYPPAKTNVPTWNYTAVHVQGVAKLVSDPNRCWQIMTQLVEVNESKYGEGWTADTEGVKFMLGQIKIFEIGSLSFDGKFKLSQQQNLKVREQAARALQKSSSEMARATGYLMWPETNARAVGEFIISGDKALVQVDAVHAFMRKSYWAKNRTLETVRKSIENSLCYGVYHGTKQIAFARVVTDSCTFAYLADVFVEEGYRGRGLSKALMEFVMSDERLKGLRRIILATADAHDLYARYGFERFSEEDCRRFMGIRRDEI